MRIALVQPPGRTPPITFPPLAMAILKPFIQNELGHHVRCFDESLGFIERVLATERCAELCHRNRSAFPEKITSSGMIGQFRFSSIRAAFEEFRNPQIIGVRSAYSRSLNATVFATGCLIEPVLDLIVRHSFLDAESQALLAELSGVHDILSFQPDMVGFSVMCQRSLASSILMARIIKERSDIPVVFGGALLPFLQRQDVLTLAEMDRGPDFIVLGPGEPAIGPLLRMISGNYDPSGKYPSIIAKGSRNRRDRNTEPDFHFNWEELPIPDFRDFSHAMYHTPLPVLPILALRGCGWGKCTFCAYDRNYSVQVRRTVEQIYNEMCTQYERHSCGCFYFSDSGIPFATLMGLSRILRANQKRFYFSCMARTEPGFRSVSRLRFMKEAGLSQITFGVESFTQRLLDKMCKGTRASHALEILSKAFSEGIDTAIFYIVGFPSQRTSELLSELRDMVTIAPKVGGIGFSEFLLLDGSPLALDSSLQQDLVMLPVNRPVLYEDSSFRINDVIIPHEIRNGIGREDARCWAQVLDEIALTWSVLFDRLGASDPCHRLVLYALTNSERADQVGSDRITSSSGPALFGSEVLLERKAESFKSHIDFLQNYRQYDPTLIDYLSAILRRKEEFSLRMKVSLRASQPDMDEQKEQVSRERMET